MHKLVIGILAAILTVAACGGSSKDKTVGAGGTTTTKASDGSGDGGDDLPGLVAKAKSADFKITYTTGDGKSQTYAQDGKGNIAFITEDSVIISDGTKTISCDGTTSSATCTDLGAQGAGALAGVTALFTTAYAGLAGLNAAVYRGHTSTETIAGRDATCVTIKASDYAGGLAGIAKAAGEASVTTCVDKDSGYLLKLSSTEPNGTKTETYLATAAGSSSPSDFEPPSPPQTIPSFTVPSFTIPSG